MAKEMTNIQSELESILQENDVKLEICNAKAVVVALSEIKECVEKAASEIVNICQSPEPTIEKVTDTLQDMSKPIMKLRVAVLELSADFVHDNLQEIVADPLNK